MTNGVGETVLWMKIKNSVFEMVSYSQLLNRRLKRKLQICLEVGLEVREYRFCESWVPEEW